MDATEVYEDGVYGGEIPLPLHTLEPGYKEDNEDEEFFKIMEVISNRHLEKLDNMLKKIDNLLNVERNRAASPKRLSMLSLEQLEKDCLFKKEKEEKQINDRKRRRFGNVEETLRLLR